LQARCKQSRATPRLDSPGGLADAEPLQYIVTITTSLSGSAAGKAALIIHEQLN
jgi:hypothetical protein